MIFIGIVAFSMLTQAIVFIVAAVAAAKGRNRVLAIVEEIRLKTLPVIDSTQSLIHDLHPKIKVIADNLVETSHIVRGKAQEFDTTISDVNQRTRAQAARVVAMVTSVLNTTAGIASTIQKGLQIPVREFSGLVSGLMAELDGLAGRGEGCSHGKAEAEYQYGDI